MTTYDQWFKFYARRDKRRFSLYPRRSSLIRRRNVLNARWKYRERCALGPWMFTAFDYRNRLGFKAYVKSDIFGAAP